MNLNEIYVGAKKLWGILLLVGALGGLGYSMISVKSAAEAAEKKSFDNSRQIAKINNIIIHDQSKLEGYMELLGIDPDNARKWSKMPKEVPLDTAGMPIIGLPWLHVVGDFEALILYKIMADSFMYVETLWVAEDDY